MKYKGNKSLLKSCRSCTYKKGIKCNGNPIIMKHKGEKYCANSTPSDKLVKKLMFKIWYQAEFERKIRYYAPLKQEKNEDTKICENSSSKVSFLKHLILKLKFISFRRKQK